MSKNLNIDGYTALKLVPKLNILRIGTVCGSEALRVKIGIGIGPKFTGIMLRFYKIWKKTPFTRLRQKNKIYTFASDSYLHLITNCKNLSPYSYSNERYSLLLLHTGVHTFILLVVPLSSSVGLFNT